MKILIISPAWIGDMVMSQSLYLTLKQQYSDVQIDLLTPEWCLPLVSCMPEISQSFKMPIGHGTFGLWARYQLGKSLRTQKYDQAIILPNSAKSALIPWFAKIPKRTGWCGEMRYGLLNDLRKGKKKSFLMLLRYVLLGYSAKQAESVLANTLDQLPCPKLHINPVAQKETILKFNLFQNNRIIGLCPGAEFGPSKRWPSQYYAEIAQRYIDKGYQVYLFGSEKDRLICNQIYQEINIESQLNCFNLAGDTSLLEAVHILSLCQVVVTNDSGLMHIASALNCFIIAIYGSTSPNYTPPLTTKKTILQTNIECQPCFKRICPLKHNRCLVALSVAQVAQEIDVALSDINNKLT